MTKSILVVDDDAMNLRMAEFILNKKNYVVYKADSGMQCLDMLRENRFDLILLDIEMPVMDGIKTLGHIRNVPTWKSIPVIFLTADGGSKSVMEAMKLGAADYIRKPFMPQDLVERVEKVIG
jgi:CheY-like chemotaxis protein